MLVTGGVEGVAGKAEGKSKVGSSSIRSGVIGRGGEVEECKSRQGKIF